MTLEELKKERDRRAKEAWEFIMSQLKDMKGEEQVAALFQYYGKEIAACQMMIEELVKHTNFLSWI